MHSLLLESDCNMQRNQGRKKLKKPYISMLIAHDVRNEAISEINHELLLSWHPIRDSVK